MYRLALVSAIRAHSSHSPSVCFLSGGIRHVSPTRSSQMPPCVRSVSSQAVPSGLSPEPMSFGTGMAVLFEMSCRAVAWLTIRSLP